MSLGLKRTLQVLRFLREFEQMRQKPICHLRQHVWHLFSGKRDLPIGPGCRLHIDEFIGDEANDKSDANFRDAPLLTVDKQKLMLPPPAPSSVIPWLDIDGRDPDKAPHVKSTLPVGYSTETFESDAERVRAFSAWSEGEWRRWAEKMKHPYRVQKLYARLFDIYLQIKRTPDDLELLWCTGLLAWRINAHEIYHPIVMTRVELDFDRTSGRMQVIPTASLPELAEEIFQGAPRETLGDFPDLAKQFRERPVAPWQRIGVDVVLTELVNSLGTQGTLVQNRAQLSGDPHVSRDDLLLLRKRRFGYARDINRWLEILKDGKEPPCTVRSIVGAHNERFNEDDAEDAKWLGLDTDLLFSLPANEEQQQIATRLASHVGVVVQGPPGTGKSHTIANLVCHLLAHGKTVLITSQTERALRVLRRKIPKSIRGLCVSLVGNDVDAQEELKQSVQQIIEATGGQQSARLRKAAQLRVELEGVRRDLSRLWTALWEAGQAERNQVSIGSQTWTPSRIGAYLVEREDQDSWISDAIESDSAIPLGDNELTELFGLLRSHNRTDTEQAVRVLPDLSSLPSSEAFELAYEEQHDRQEKQRQFEAAIPAIQRWSPPSQMELEKLREICNLILKDVEVALEDLRTFQVPWLQAIRFELQQDPNKRDWWSDFSEKLADRINECSTRRSRIAHKEVKVELDGPIQQQIDAVEVLKIHAQDGGSFGRTFKLLHKRQNQVRERCQLDGALPSLADDFDVILDWLHVKRCRLELSRLVSNELGRFDESLRLFSEVPERGATDILNSLRRLLAWREQSWERLRERLSTAGCELRERSSAVRPAGNALVIEEAANEIKTATVIQKVLQALVLKIDILLFVQWRSNLLKDLEKNIEKGGAADAWGFLLSAARQGDANLWSNGLSEVKRLSTIKPDAERFWLLHGSLSKATPTWARSLLDSFGSSTYPSVAEVHSAWLWSQLETWMRRHLAQRSPDELRREIETQRRTESNLIERLVTESTWGSLKVASEERQALAGWQQTTAKIGKGTGKLAPALKRQAQKLMSEARHAVPVWIMPMSRVIDNFAADGPKFDVVIVDESSQCDTFGLLALLRANRAVIVGDDNQISPAAVGQRIDVIQELIDRYLDDIPNKHLYDGQQSLYDLATASFGGVIRLREHFRCVPRIISFSNDLCYHDIRPLREATDSHLKPSVVLERIDGARTPGTKVNPYEADYVSALLAACCEHPAYKDASVGVISLLGEEQSREIQDRVRELVAAEELERRNFVVGDAYHFQGDERDVMFLSTVESPSGQAPATLNKRADQQRFNVAASRARNQMWIVHSIDAGQLNPEDMRARLLSHYGLKDQREQNWKEVDDLLSDHERYYFQRLVANRIIDRGYRTRAEVEVGHYRIDLVIDGDQRSLAVECDGERWHTLDNLSDDVARQMTLERLGWKFARIRGGEFFRDPDKALQSLWRRLTELGITPQESDVGEPQSSVLEEIRFLTKKYLEKIRGPFIETATHDEQPPQSDGNGPGGSSEAESSKARVEPPPVVEVQSEEALRIALLRLRDGIMRTHPEVPRERGLLRMRMLQALIRHLPTSVEEFDRLIPKVLRDETEPSQLRYLPQVIQVIADHVSGKSGAEQSALFR
jgi:very-short-patch-repair endonuclease